VPPIYNYLYNTLAMPISVIPGQTIKLRMLWNAYTWAIVATIISFIFLKPTGQQIKNTFVKFGQRAIKPMIGIVVFFALGILMSNTGLDPDAGWVVTDPTNSMIAVLAKGSVQLFQSVFPIIVAPLAAFGGFITSSQVSSVVMFASYNIQAATTLGMNILVFLAISIIAGGIVGIIAPGKLLNAAAVIGAIGEEQIVMKKLFKYLIILLILMCALCFIAGLIIPPIST